MNDFELQDKLTIELTKLEWLMVIQGLQRNKQASQALAMENKKRGLNGCAMSFRAVSQYHEDMLKNQETIDLVRGTLFTEEQIEMANKINKEVD